MHPSDQAELYRIEFSETKYGFEDLYGKRYFEIEKSAKSIGVELTKIITERIESDTPGRVLLFYGNIEHNVCFVFEYDWAWFDTPEAEPILVEVQYYPKITPKTVDEINHDRVEYLARFLKGRRKSISENELADIKIEAYESLKKGGHILTCLKKHIQSISSNPFYPNP